METPPSSNHDQDDNRPRWELLILLLALLMSFCCVFASAELAVLFWPERLTSTNLLAKRQANYAGGPGEARFAILDPSIADEAATDVARLKITPSDDQDDDSVSVVVLPGTPTPTATVTPSPTLTPTKIAGARPRATNDGTPTGQPSATPTQQDGTATQAAPTSTPLPPLATVTPVPTPLDTPTPNILPSPSPQTPPTLDPPPDDNNDSDNDNNDSSDPLPPTPPPPTPPPPLAQISGQVFEDTNYNGGPGTAFGGSDAPLPNVRVELYAASTLIGATTTDATGSYTLSNIPNGAYTVRIVSATIGDADTPPAAGFNSGSVSVVAEQTFERNGSTGNGAAGALGGNNPNIGDLATAAGAGSGDTNVSVTVNGVDVAGVDFGFAYNLVVNIDDAGQGTLRQTLNNANAIAGTDTIVFNIMGVNPYTIRPLSNLPIIRDAIILDGTTQPGFAGRPIVELDGTISGGLVITAGNSTVRGLAINRAGVGLDLSSNDNYLIQGNFIGTDASGTTALGGMSTGIRLSQSLGNVIGGANPGEPNLISGNRNYGVLIDDVPSPGRVISGQQVLYTFEEGSGTVISDVSGVGLPIDLTVEDPARVSWGSDSLFVNDATRISAPSGANRIYNACTASNEVTLEAWVTPANDTQDGPARIVTFSQSPVNRNFTIGQDGDIYVVRLRTTTNGDNGINTILTANVSITSTHVVFTRDVSGTAVLYLDGAVADTDTIGGDFSNWDPGFDFGLANEFNTASTTQNRDWQGEYNLISVYCRALSSAEVNQNYNALVRNLIQGNMIGTDVTGTTALGNGTGIYIQNASNTTIGGISPGEGNIIAYNNPSAGIVIVGNNSNGNTITRNSIYANNGLGIDLSDDGPTANDPGDGDGGPNSRLNFPLIYTATITGSNVIISGEAHPNSKVEVFIADPDPTGYGEGQTFIGAGFANGTTPGTTDATARRFSFLLPKGSLIGGNRVTATATDSAGNTSEFGPNIAAN